MSQLAKPSDLALLVGVPATNGKLLLALTRASDRFEGAVRYAIQKVTDDKIDLSGDGGRTLLLPAIPVVGTPTVSENGTPITDFQIGRRHGVMRRAAGWRDGLDNYHVTYTHGYDEVPGDIVDAVLEQAEATYRLLVGVANVGSGSESIGYFASVTTGVTQRWTEAVERYQIGTADRA